MHIFLEARAVNGVPTSHKDCWDGTRLKKLAANRAIRLHQVRRALVAFTCGDRKTGLALFAMEKILRTTHSADSTCTTVKLLFVDVVKEVADTAKVLSHSEPAAAANLLRRLGLAALKAAYLLDRVSVQSVPLARIRLLLFDGLIVTEPAWKETSSRAAWSEELATPPVVLTTATRSVRHFPCPQNAKGGPRLNSTVFASWA